MKHLLFLMLTFITLASCQGQENKDKTISTSEKENKIEVIDFHTTHRCKTCLQIEKNTKAVLEKYFKKEQEAGKVVLRIINIDEDENMAIAERFQAAGSSLFINRIKDGKETHFDLTDFAFMKAFNQEEFFKELKQEIDQQLKEL